MRWELFKEQTESASCYGAFFLSLSALSGFLATYQANDTALIATSIFGMSSGLFLMGFGYEHDETKPTIALRLQGAMYRLCIAGAIISMQERVKDGFFSKYCQLLGVHEQPTSPPQPMDTGQMSRILREYAINHDDGFFSKYCELLGVHEQPTSPPQLMDTGQMSRILHEYAINHDSVPQQHQNNNSTEGESAKTNFSIDEATRTTPSAVAERKRYIPQ